MDKKVILFLSGLDKQVTENQLFSLFNDYPITYIKIAKNHLTKESFGYAFVGFRSLEKAEQAMIKLNYTKVGKKTLRISWYDRESSSLRLKTQNNIFVKRLDENLKHQEFHEYFSSYGNIVSAKLEEDDEGDVKGYGFVLYDTEESAKKAINEANNIVWKGRNIFVGPYIKKKPQKELSFNSIYVKNIPKVFITNKGLYSRPN